MELRERAAAEKFDELDEHQKSLIDSIDAELLPMRKKYRSVSELTRNKLLVLVKEQGVSIKRAAKKLRINYSTAKSICYNNQKGARSVRNASNSLIKLPKKLPMPASREMETTGKFSPEEEKPTKEPSTESMSLENVQTKAEDNSLKFDISPIIRVDQPQITFQSSIFESNLTQPFKVGSQVGIKQYQPPINNQIFQNNTGYLGHHFEHLTMAPRPNTQALPSLSLPTLNPYFIQRETLISRLNRPSTPQIFHQEIANAAAAQKLVSLDRLKFLSRNVNGGSGLPMINNSNVNVSLLTQQRSIPFDNTVNELQRLNLLRGLSSRNYF